MQDKVHILIVEDEPLARSILRRCYESAGYQVGEAANIAEARAQLAQRRYNLVTIDVKLESPDGNSCEDGKALAGEVRAQYDYGIIMVTGNNNNEERNNWLESWADDSITKPFVNEELLARTRAVLRRYGVGPAREPDGGARSGDIAYFAGWTLDLKRHELRSPDGSIVALTMGDFNLLRNLLKHPDEVLSRDRIVEMDTSIQLMNSGDSARAVDMRISRLRQKLGDDEKKELIRTIRTAGYMFAPEVTWAESKKMVRPTPEMAK